ncbi:MAG: hypothetical protein V1836_01305 [Candidatus Aenigmatarchaeota archaeon]
MKHVMAVVAIVLVVLVSGCTDNNTTQPMKTNEIVVLENTEAVPNEVKPERNFVLNGFVTNNAEEKVGNVRVELSDYCSSVFDVEKTTCALTSSDGYSACAFQLGIGASKKFQWNLKAPTAERTANRNFDCSMIVKTNYSYVSRGSVGVIFANNAEIAAREAGLSSVTSDGPVKTYITIESPQPIGKDEIFDVKIVIRNEGAGEIEGGGITKPNFKLAAPSELTVNCDTPLFIDLSGTKKESDPIFCTIKAPDSLPPRVTKYLTAELSYAYKFTSVLPVKLVVEKP